MKILYLSASYVPSRRASSIQVMEMCQAFAELGHDVTLVAKSARFGDVDDYTFYGLPANFPIVKLRRPAGRGGSVIFALSLVRLVMKMRTATELAYSRNFMAAWLASRLGIPTIFEAHQLAPGAISRALFKNFLHSRNLTRLVSITDQLRNDLVENGLVPKFGDMVVASSAVNASKFPNITFRANPSRLQVGYVGSLYEGRGIDLIVRVAESLPQVMFHVVGGNRKELEDLVAKEIPSNLLAHGFVNPEELGRYYSQFDILLMPHQDRVRAASGRGDIARWCSPIKLFEYMASGKAIIASDLPVLGEVLRHNENAQIVSGSDVSAWVSSIKELAVDSEKRRRLGIQARRECLSRYTWKTRAERVLNICPLESQLKILPYSNAYQR